MLKVNTLRLVSWSSKLNVDTKVAIAVLTFDAFGLENSLLYRSVKAAIYWPEPFKVKVSLLLGYEVLKVYRTRHKQQLTLRARIRGTLSIV